MRKLILSLLLSACALPAFAQETLIKNATVLTPSGLKQSQDLLIIDGEIRRIGTNLDAPADTEILSGDNYWVTPPLFAPLSTLGLVEVGNVDRTNDVRAAKSKTSVSENVSDSFNSQSVHIANVRRRGILYAVVSPDSSGDSIFAGTGMIAVLDSELAGRHKNAAFIRVDLGETGTNRAGGSRAAAMRQLRAALDDAAAYPSRYKSPTDGDTLSRQDAAALAKAARGQMPIIVSANRASDLLNLVKLKQDYPALKLIVLGAAEAWKLGNTFRDNDIKLIIDPLDNLPTSFEKVGSRLDNVVMVDSSRNDYAIANLTSLGVTKPASLAQHAGNAVAEGLSWEKAFAAISSTPARWFGITLQPVQENAEASLVLWDGDPLEVTSAPLRMWHDRQELSLQSRQSKLRDRYNPTSQDTRPHKYR